MSGAPKVFISHSAHTEHDRAVLNELCGALREQGLNVLADPSIRTGDEWDSRINTWIHECHAAVVLLSETALKSPWVHAEVIIVTSRKRRERDLALIVVPLGNVKLEAIKANPYLGDVARLPQWQWLRVTAESDIIGTVKECLQGLVPAETPFDGLVLCLKALLRTDSLESSFEGAVRALKTESPVTESPAQGAADALIRALLRNPGGALDLICKLVGLLRRSITYDSGKQLLEMLQGMWVSAEAAAQLIEASERKAPAGINCVYTRFTAESYARRAWPDPHIIKIVKVGPARTLHEIENVLLTGAWPRLTPERAKVHLAQTEDRRHVLLVFPAPDAMDEAPPESLPDKSLLDELRDKYPGVTILVATGNVDTQSLPHLTLLRPPLGAGDEEKQLRAYERIEDLVEDLQKRS